MAKKNVFFILSAVIIGIVAAAVLLLKNNQTVDLNAQNYHNGVKEKNEKDKSFWGSKSGSRNVRQNQ